MRKECETEYLEPKRKEAKRKRRKLHSAELYHLYALRPMRNANKILVVQLEKLISP
jgi:hypothetical protein